MKSKIELYPLKDMTEVKAGVYMIYKDFFWIVDKDNNLLKYRGMSWQCNIHKNIVEDLRDKCYPECSVLQLPYVYAPWNG